MNSVDFPAPRNSGFTMIEVLVSLVIIAFGLLGLAGLQTRMQQAEFESYQRSQALVLLYDMVDRININRATVPCFVVTDPTTGLNYLGAGAALPPACAYSTTGNNASADSAIAEWDNLLKGAAETKGVNQAGAMVGARGCISYDSTSELTDPTGAIIAGTGAYTIAVAWQGTVDTFKPTVHCADGLYDAADLQRRVVSTTFRLAQLK